MEKKVAFVAAFFSLLCLWSGAARSARAVGWLAPAGFTPIDGKSTPAA
jgi:hypothetical protein